MTVLRCVLLVTMMLLGGLQAARTQTVGGVDYAPEYDFSEFWAATDGRFFRVIVAGNPFPQMPVEEAKQRMLPVMQANKPRPALTFTYQQPPDQLRPDYRLVLVFDPANDLTAARVCRPDLPEEADGAAYAGPCVCLRNLLPQRPCSVADHGLDAGQWAGGSPARPDVRPAVPDLVRRPALAPLALQSVVCPLADPA